MFSPELAALSPTFTSSSGTPTPRLEALCAAMLPRSLSALDGTLSRGPAMLAPPEGATLMLAVVLTLSLLGRLALLDRLSWTSLSSSRIRLLRSSFSVLAASSSLRKCCVSSYLTVAGIMPGLS